MQTFCPQTYQEVLLAGIAIIKRPEPYNGGRPAKNSFEVIDGIGTVLGVGPDPVTAVSQSLSKYQKMLQE